MSLTVTRYDLKEFQALIPLLTACFPDFWNPRLAEGKYSFPYDLKLFAARLKGELMGCIGVHDHQYLLDNTVIPCGGVCDVAVAPEFRGRGYSVELQNFFMAYCREHYKAVSLMPLYTGKPGVYAKQGWVIYESDRSNEIKIGDFPPEKTFRFDADQLSLSCLRGKTAPRNQEEEKALRVMDIYLAGKKFNGKVMRSGKSWWELFADRRNRWRLEQESYFLYQEDLLLEAYSADPATAVSAFTPKHGGFEEDNKLLVNLPRLETEADLKTARALEKGTLVFPAADIF